MAENQVVWYWNIMEIYLYQLNRKEEALEYWKRALTKDDYSDLLQKKVNDKKLYE